VEKVVSMANLNQTDNHLHNRSSDFIRRLRQAGRRLTVVTTHICGSTPECVGESPKPIEEHLHDKFDNISNIITDIEEEMTRLENSIGSNQLQPMQAKTAVGY
jgi:hypothetical protein